MQAREEYSVRLEMSQMHEEFIEKMSDAFDHGFYVEAVWYCYAIFEQRISRLIAKYIDKCNICESDREDDKSASISTRIKCIKRIISNDYYGFGVFDVNLFNRITDWCECRNELVHGLVSLNHYKKYDEEFKKLAESGVPLVFELYDACTDFRNNWYDNTFVENEFPVKKCKCKKTKCINPNII